MPAYLVPVETHTSGRRVLRINATDPSEARKRAAGRKGVRNVLKVYRAETLTRR